MFKSGGATNGAVSVAAENTADTTAKEATDLGFVVDAIEAEEIIRQLRVYDNVYITDHEFGRLKFRLNVSKLDVLEAVELIDRITEVSDTIDISIDHDGDIDFDYFVTADLVPVFRGIVNEFTNSYYGACLKLFQYTPH